MTVQHHRRHSLRLKNYDYAQAGAYFITICTQDRACLFGDIVDGEMRLNEIGRMVISEWDMLPERFPNVVLDAFVVMPNHVHGIIVITSIADVGAGLVPAPNGSTTQNWATTRVAPTVGDVVGAFKSRITVEYVRGVKTSGWPPFRGCLWQRNYYEHIIRDEAALHAIREYTANNPLQWALDRENPANVGAGLVPAHDRATTPNGATARAAPTAWRDV
jgi:REP element-mobilizing transposase RayT